MKRYHSASTPALLSKFIDSIEVKLQKAEYLSITQPFYFSGVVKSADVFVGLHKGPFFHGKEIYPVKEGSFYFIPRGQQVNAGTAAVLSDPAVTNISSFADEQVKKIFTEKINTQEDVNQPAQVISFVAFDTILYNSLPFFPLLELPPFVIEPDDRLAYLLREICLEKETQRLGREVILKNYTSQLMVLLFRHIGERPGFDKAIDKLQYLTDNRLISIVKHIQENLGSDLNNSTIAKVAEVSDEYVGQFFKSLTGRTLQDYIEEQRMERAMQLIRTIPNSVQEIAGMVGFKDAAYFSRRFKMHFNVNANVLRQTKN